MPENKPLDLAPFTGLQHRTNEIIEGLLCDIWRGVEWTDNHEHLLTSWRAARGDDAKDAWWWWIGQVDGESYDQDIATRGEALELGTREYAEQGRFVIVEARLWRDAVKDGEDVMSFAETRNREVIVIGEGGDA